ncbi:MAG: hypothetical protein LBB56_01660 [Chitinispirillales bacterium]|jgi:hypothetical protein|nr:hypothetical protein [Chitinispirillales bacterium]
MVSLKNCSIDKFISYAKGKKVYAFGAGQYIRQKSDLSFKYNNIEKTIFKFTDNDSNKWGKDYIVNDYAIPIISTDDFVRSINKNDIILISSYYSYPDVVEQLDKIDALDGIDCFIFPYVYEYFVDNVVDNEKLKNSKEKEPQIPKKIHYVWFGGNEMSDKLKKCMESWYKFCPDYEIIRWDESNYDVTKNQFIKSAYEAKKYSKVSNYTRLDIVYNNGGIYLDNDVEIIKPLDDLLFHQAFAGFRNCIKKIEIGSGFGGKKHFELFREIRECCGDESYSDEYNTKVHIASHNLLYTKGFLPDNSFQCVNGLSIYPTCFFNPLNSVTGILKITDDTYSIHWFTYSWDSHIRDNMNRRLKFYNKNKDRISDIETMDFWRPN